VWLRVGGSGFGVTLVAADSDLHEPPRILSRQDRASVGRIRRRLAGYGVGWQQIGRHLTGSDVGWQDRAAVGWIGQ